jgi:adenylate cyclase class IV
MEQELKLGLAHPEALDDLLAALPRPRAVCEQTNHYFVDDAGQLSASRTMVRVRVSRRLDCDTPDVIVLTRKRRLQAHDGYFIAEEVESPLEPARWAEVLSGQRDLLDLDPEPLRGLGLTSPLTCHGVMRNLRHVIDCGGFVLEVDRTELPGDRVDCEVEVETDDPEGARRLVTARADAAGVALFAQERGKYARFLAALAG